VFKAKQNTEQSEQKFNKSYKVFLANRPQMWEENAVSRVLGLFDKVKQDFRCILLNLSLASSFLKIRKAKKASPKLSERLLGDTSICYLNFHQKNIK